MIMIIQITVVHLRVMLNMLAMVIIRNMCMVVSSIMICTLRIIILKKIYCMEALEC